MVKRRTQYHHAVRIQKRRENLLRATKLFEASLLGDMDLLKEMRNVKSGGTARADLADTVDGANGEEEIVDKFRDVYSTLYNSSGSQEEMLRLNNRINSLIGPKCIAEVAKLTGAAVKEAASKLKPKKSDVSGGFTSDAILHAPDILSDQLAMAYRSWIVHGTVTPTLLACAFLSLPKS